MVNPFAGKAPDPDFDRLTRATDPRLRQPIPALNVPIENANQTADKVIYTMNRGGSNPRNPLLAGLGTRFQFSLSRSDQVKALYVFQDRAALGNNLKSNLQPAAPGVYNFDTLLGSGLTAAGSPALGAKKNFVRLVSASGTIEREFYVKSYDADIIACNGQNALDAETLEPVVIELDPADAGEEGWIDVAIDFFVSWNDEFQKMHNGGNPYLNPGFLKAYGGAAFVSFFDTDPGDEGTGVQCNPVTQAPINDQHLIQIEATEGNKLVTVRFRSKQDSVYFVDVDIIFHVPAVPVPEEPPPCNPPQVDENVNIYIPPIPPWEPPDPPPTDDPPYTPDTPSTPTDDPNSIPPITEFPVTPEDPHTPSQAGVTGRIIVTLDGQALVAGAGGTALVKVVRWTAQPSQYFIGGVSMVQQSVKYYNPAVTAIEQGTPLGAPYDDQQKFTILLDETADLAALVCFYTVSLYQKNALDIWKQGAEKLVPGPAWRQMNVLPQPNLGYGPGSCGGSGFPNIADNGSCPA